MLMLVVLNSVIYDIVFLLEFLLKVVMLYYLIFFKVCKMLRIKWWNKKNVIILWCKMVCFKVKLFCFWSYSNIFMVGLERGRIGSKVYI